MTNAKQHKLPLCGLIVCLVLCPTAPSLNPADVREEFEIECHGHSSDAVCILGHRYSLNIGSFESRGAGDVEGHPMILLGRGGIGKFVGSATDQLNNQSVFVKCRPTVGGEGSVAELVGWREVEAERAVNGHRNVLGSMRRMPMRDGGECAIYPLAGGSLTDRLMQSPHSSMPAAEEIESALVQVLRGIAAMHRSGYVHRDIKVLALQAIASSPATTN